MEFRLPKKLSNFLMNLGIAILMFGLFFLRSIRMYTDMGLPAYTGFIVMAAGALIILLSFIIPAGSAGSNIKRLGTGEPALTFRGPLEIITDPRPAFRMNGVTYELRKPAEPFFASFGAPDWMDDADATYSGWNAENLTREEFNQMYLAYTTGYFYASGAEVRVDGYRLIKSVSFFPLGMKVEGMELSRAEFTTSLGINQNSRPEDIVKAYGDPSSRQTDAAPNVLGQMDDKLRYRFGEEVLAFNYTDGRFRSVCLFWDPKKIFG